MAGGSCRDLRKYQDDAQVAELFGQLISGKKGYKTIIEKSPKIIRCTGCGKVVDDEAKFCPECGTKVVKEEKKD